MKKTILLSLAPIIFLSLNAEARSLKSSVILNKRAIVKLIKDVEMLKQKVNANSVYTEPPVLYTETPIVKHKKHKKKRKVNTDDYYNPAPVSQIPAEDIPIATTYPADYDPSTANATTTYTPAKDIPIAKTYPVN